MLPLSVRRICLACLLLASRCGTSEAMHEQGITVPSTLTLSFRLCLCLRHEKGETQTSPGADARYLARFDNYYLTQYNLKKHLLQI
jgi:hypothetical protein